MRCFKWWESYLFRLCNTYKAYLFHRLIQAPSTSRKDVKTYVIIIIIKLNQIKQMFFFLERTQVPAFAWWRHAGPGLKKIHICLFPVRIFMVGVYMKNLCTINFLSRAVFFMLPIQPHIVLMFGCLVHCRLRASLCFSHGPPYESLLLCLFHSDVKYNVGIN